jgi:hypothetical protein
MFGAEAPTVFGFAVATFVRLPPSGVVARAAVAATAAIATTASAVKRPENLICRFPS